MRNRTNRCFCWHFIIRTMNFQRLTLTLYLILSSNQSVTGTAAVQTWLCKRKQDPFAFLTSEKLKDCPLGREEEIYLEWKVNFTMPNFKTLTLEYAHSKVSMAVYFPHKHVHLFLLEYDHVAPYFNFVSFHVLSGNLDYAKASKAFSSR